MRPNRHMAVLATKGLMELDAQGHEITNAEVAAKAAIELIGNVKDKINHLCQSKVISQLNITQTFEKLLPLCLSWSLPGG